MIERSHSGALVSSWTKSLSLFAVAIGTLILLFWLFTPVYRHSEPIAATGAETTLVVEGGKELDSIVIMLTTLTTGLFVLVAIAARGPLKPTVCPPGGHMILLPVFVVSASGSYYMAMHAKYAIADGLLAKSLDLDRINSQIGIQAWFVAFAGAAAVALLADAFLTVKS